MRVSDTALSFEDYCFKICAKRERNYNSLMSYSPRYVYTEPVKNEKNTHVTENYGPLSVAKGHKRNPTFDINSLKYRPILQ